MGYGRVKMVATRGGIAAIGGQDGGGNGCLARAGAAFASSEICGSPALGMTVGAGFDGGLGLSASLAE